MPTSGSNVNSLIDTNVLSELRKRERAHPLVVELRTWLFPVSCFAFGQGEHRYETKDTVHWGIIITFVVSRATSMMRLIR